MRGFGVLDSLQTLSTQHAVVLQRRLHQVVVLFLKERLGRSDRIGRIRDDDVKLALVLLHELEAVANVQRELGTAEARRHVGKVLLRNINHHLLNIHLSYSRVALPGMLQ